MTMTNKQYREARDMAESAYELDTFVSYEGIFGRANRYMKPDDIKEMRSEYKEIATNKNAFALQGFGGRALVIRDGDVVTLQSYYTEVCRYNMKTDTFEKLWDGFSVTTLKHINLFREFLGLEKLSKREWIEISAV